MDLIYILAAIIVTIFQDFACLSIFTRYEREVAKNRDMILTNFLVSALLTLATRKITSFFITELLSFDQKIGPVSDVMFIILNLILTVVMRYVELGRMHKRQKAIVPVSVNFMFTRKCNFNCGFCFHTDTSSHLESFDNIKRGLRMLRAAGMKKINFGGGEPFSHPVLLRRMLKFCKEDLALESVSIVTNGSKLTDTFMSANAKYIDIIAVSVDSFDERTNVQIGRGAGNHLQNVTKVANLCRKYQVMFKVNTVVNRYNLAENINAQIQALQPFRWKVFQVLIVQGENDSAATKRDARRFCISDEEFQQFCARHHDNECFVPQSNDVMKNSYLMLDEHLRFLNNGTGAPTESILDVGATEALKNVSFDKENFVGRGGIYNWTRAPTDGCISPALEF